MMTKKHYIKIAEIIKKQITDLNPSLRSNKESVGIFEPLINKTAKDLSEYFKQDNPNFNQDLFLKACGVQ